MRILALLTITELLLGGAGLTVSWLLINSSARIRELGSRLSQAVESVYVTEQAERALLVHNRESYFYYITKRPEHLRQRSQAERRLKEALNSLRAFTESPRERELFESASENVTLYLEERATLEKEGKSGDEINVAIIGLLEEAEEALITLTQINYEQAQSLHVRAQHEDSLNAKFGAIVGAVLLLLLTTAFLLVHLGLRRPLVRLKREIAGSEELSEIAPQGPLEMREISNAFNGLVRATRAGRESYLRFIAGVAHDIRTPLNAIKLSTDLLDSAKLDDEERSTLEAIKRQISQLSRQVGDLLDTSRVESGDLDLKISQEDLRVVADNCVKVFRGWSERHTITIAVPESPVICPCDATRVGQVVNNLISNALKYSPSGGTVAVSISQDDGSAYLKVTDQGIGIAQEDLASIFEPFHRSGATREAIPGVGLGLSVSRKIAKAHHGSIEVASTRGVGSTFTLRLPLEKKGTE